ncbi:MAG: insulinase family protein [Rhizobiales bacterium]|nr:insulinase family protein [Hyphomicrobiales bacterium]NRB13524.1 insulinase family protein [Hyphomicrobiales bacterium]
MTEIITTKIEDGVYSSQLPNGLTVVTHEMPLQSVAVGAWIKAGSRNETLDNNGIAHFLEHMAFKGTTTRSAKQIVEIIENVGGDMNASTGIEVTSYYFRLLKNDLPLGIEILADILLNPLFLPEEMDKEKQVILQEIAATDDDPDDILYDRMIEDAFANQAIGRSILGTPKSVKSLTKQNLTDFLHNLYVPENITIAMAGGATHQQMLELVTQYFAAMPAKSAPALQPAKFTANEVSIAKSLEQNYLVTGFEAYHFNHADYFAQQIMSQILGGGMSSRLFQNIREDSGLCYSIYSSSWGFDDTGLMFIYAAASQANIDIVKDLINKEIFDIIANVSQPELNRACAQIKAAQLMSLESPVSRSEQIARQSIFYKQLIKIDDIIEKLEAVTVADIKRVANDIFIKSGAQLNADGKFQLSDLTPSITINLGEAVDV